MKRIFTVFAALMLVAGIASAAPSIYGSTGQLLTISPNNCGPKSFGIGFHGLWSTDETDSANSWMNIDWYPEGYFAFSDMFEFSAAPGYRTLQTTVSDSSDWYNGALDARFGLKASFIRGEGFNFGTYLGYDYRYSKKWLTDEANSAYYDWVNDAWEKTDTNYSPMGTIHFTLIPGIKSGNGCAYLNLGVDYNMDKREIGDPVVDHIYPKLSVPFGIGVGYDLSKVKLMLDVAGTAWVSDSNTYLKSDATEYSAGMMNYPLWVAPTLRIKFGPGFNFDLGFAYNLQDDDSTIVWHAKEQDWMLIGGLAFSKCNLGPKVPATGIITGKVTDKAGKALAATVMAGGITANTDPATGDYTLSGVLIEKIPVEIKAEAKAYISKTASVMLTKKNKKTPAVQDFTLELKPIPASDVTGTVIDYKTGNPVPATVTFKGIKTVTVTADAAGKYTAKLDPGTYATTASAAGYNNSNATVIAKDGKPVIQNIGMVKSKEVFSFSNITFATGKADITPAVATALQPLLKVLLDNPDLKVEISGHTDALGTRAQNLKLSQARSDAVVAWLITQNVKNQMTAKGYGEEKPIATNNTKAGRATNRRVEINVAD